MTDLLPLTVPEIHCLRAPVGRRGGLALVALATSAQDTCPLSTTAAAMPDNYTVVEQVHRHYYHDTCLFIISYLRVVDPFRSFSLPNIPHGILPRPISDKNFQKNSRLRIILFIHKYVVE